MRSRLLAALPMVLALPGCDPLGSGGNFPDGFRLISSLPDPLQYEVGFVFTPDTAVGVGQGRYFAIEFRSNAFQRIELMLHQEGRRAEYRGVVCQPTGSCGTETLSPARMTLALHSAKEVKVHVVGVTPGAVRMELLAHGPPCDDLPVRKDCGTHYSRLTFNVVP